MTRQATDEEIAWWDQLTDFQAHAHNQISNELRRTGLSLTTYLALDRIVRHAGPMRISELAAAIHLTPSSASRLVKKLVAENHLTRSACGDDRRGVFGHLTDRGRTTHEKATHHYRTALAQAIDHPTFSGTTPKEKN
ncbi:MarR family winged helix-turn-helix transcriptional regulator [Streptomyces rubiginosohelvolus]|uniref:MarR family winged helix-turn-helix transcriptional regulator n=1 Tax=Streptomyces rubiginosohelvolus TaxID=67362 RepID=UPI0036AC788D